jgi:two-component system, OmpR family, response regulator
VDADRGHILIVEDDMALAALLQAALEFEGYRVHVEHDGRGARAALDLARPDLLLLDLMMPENDGLDLCAWVRARESDEERLPIVVMTALNRRIYQALSQARGADDYLANCLSQK